MRKALCIGNDNYDFAKLTSCINDAMSLASILETNGDGSPNFDVNKLSDGTTSEMLSLIKELFNTESDTALLFYAGHGCKSEIGTYICGTDNKECERGLKMDDILNIANESRTRNKIIILDTCYSGSMGAIASLTENKALLSDGMTILSASRFDEVSIEISGHGLFTSLLLDGLQGGAADLRGNITPGSIYAYVDQALGAWDQRPVFKTNVSKFTILRSLPPQVPIGILRKITDYFKSPEDEYDLDPSYENTNDPNIDHKYIEPYANNDHTKIFKDLQKFESVGLVIPIGEEHMYFAAMNSKSCKLTALGYHYWRLVKDRRI